MHLVVSCFDLAFILVSLVFFLLLLVACPEYLLLEVLVGFVGSLVLKSRTIFFQSGGVCHRPTLVLRQSHNPQP